MPPPFPPQGNQRQYTERPSKIYGEQYRVGQPIPGGVSTELVPPVYAEGQPRVYAANGRTYPVQDTDWVITNRYTGQPVEVISDQEFTERFGGASAGKV